MKKYRRIAAAASAGVAVLTVALTAQVEVAASADQGPAFTTPSTGVVSPQTTSWG